MNDIPLVFSYPGIPATGALALGTFEAVWDICQRVWYHQVPAAAFFPLLFDSLGSLLSPSFPAPFTPLILSSFFLCHSESNAKTLSGRGGKNKRRKPTRGEWDTYLSEMTERYIERTRGSWRDDVQSKYTRHSSEVVLDEHGRNVRERSMEIIMNAFL